MSCKFTIISTGDGSALRITAGDYHVEFDADCPAAFDAAAQKLIEQAAGFSKHELMMATLAARAGAAK